MVLHRRLCLPELGGGFGDVVVPASRLAAIPGLGTAPKGPVKKQAALERASVTYARGERGGFGSLAASLVYGGCISGGVA